MSELMKLKPILLTLVLALIYLGVYGWNLHFPMRMYFDELYQASTAQQLLGGKMTYLTVHPPFGIMLMSLSILIFDGVSWSWRVLSLFSGLGCLVLTYQILKKLTHNSTTAALSVILLGMDGLFFTQARIGMLNAPALFLMLSAIRCFIQVEPLKSWDREKALVLSGLLLGLALSTKWLAALTALFLALLISSAKNDRDTNRVKEVLLYMILLPAAVYLVVFLYFPYFYHLEWKGLDWSWITKFQQSSTEHHLSLGPQHFFGSQWWTWPLMTRPVLYYSFQTPNKLSCILCIGNPAIFWAIPLGIGTLLWDWWKNKSWVSGFVALGFFTHWLPWMFVSRYKFLHYFYPAMPFVAMALAIGLEKLWRKGPAGKGLTLIYLAVVTGLFVYWYPLLNGTAVSREYYNHHMWLSSWKVLR